MSDSEDRVSDKFEVLDEIETFDDAYKGTPPWDIGRAQSELVELVKEGEIKGEVLDSGCGTGEHSLYLASKGYNVTGVDSSSRAVEKAKNKLRERQDDLSGDVDFQVLDALEISSLGGSFDTVIDVGLFHVFPDEEREKYVDELSKVLNEDSKYFVLCFSENEPGDSGPRRISKGELHETFNNGWDIEYIRDADFEILDSDRPVRGYLASIRRKK